MDSPILGIEIGGTKLQIVCGEAGGKITLQQRFAVDPASGAEGIRGNIESHLFKLRTQTSIQAIGVGFGGPVDWRTGVVARSHQVEGWSGFELSTWLRSLTGARVVVDNDANVAALGEALSGAGRGFASVFYVTLGSGVGGGMVLDGKIYHGAIPGESEIGHLRLDRSGTIVESACSGWAVDRAIRNLPESERQGALWNLTRGMQAGEASMLSKALAAKDPAAERILRETSQTLAFALSHVTHLLHPQVIIIGGGLSNIGDPLRAAVEAALPHDIMDVFKPGPLIRLAGLKENAVPIGALHLAEPRNV